MCAYVLFAVRMITSWKKKEKKTRIFNQFDYFLISVSAQDAGQNYQVQYVDTELYHSNSSQTQM